MRDPNEIQAAIDNLRMQEVIADAEGKPLIGAAVACVVSVLRWTMLQDSDFDECLGESGKAAVN